MRTLFHFSLMMSHMKVSVFLVCVVKLDVMPNHQILAGYAPVFRVYYHIVCVVHFPPIRITSERLTFRRQCTS